ncbi:MAG: Eco57I restriction-modification methylase domain-containing protein [Prevotella sp.]|nr:Eco57I restriction-modification methylase domain-containing protein [Prevotella sp.]
MNEALTYQAYYTKSDPILNYMIGMLHFCPQDSVLEPCGGDGVFVDKILEKSPSSNIFIYELNPVAAGNLRNKYKEDSNVYVKETDTLLDNDVVSCRHRFDRIIGNPPYGARNDEHKKSALNRLYANLYTKESYTLFLYACTRCLNENGELSFIIPDTFLSLHRHLAIRKFLLTNTQIRELALFPSSFFPGVNFGYANLCIITLVKSSDIDKNMHNCITIRTDFKSVYDLENSHAGTTKRISQKTVYEGVSSAFMFNSTDRLTELINDTSIQKIGDIASCVTGFYSGNDKKYLHPIDDSIKNAKKYTCAREEQIRTTSLTEEEKTYGIKSQQCLVPIVKGGNVEYIKPNNWFMDWSIQAISEYRVSKKCRFQNSTFYFRNGIGIPMIRSTKLTGALIDGRLFDQSIVGVFPKDAAWTLYLLGFINSAICTNLINAINPSTNNSANYIKKIPFVKPNNGTRKKIELLVKEIISSIERGDDVSNIQIEIDDLFSKLYIDKIGMESNSATKLSIKQLNLFEDKSVSKDILYR